MLIFHDTCSILHVPCAMCHVPCYMLHVLVYGLSLMAYVYVCMLCLCLGPTFHTMLIVSVLGFVLISVMLCWMLCLLSVVCSLSLCVCFVCECVVFVLYAAVVYCIDVCVGVGLRFLMLV